MSNDILGKIEILYEDPDIAAVNKPAGLMVHPDGRAKEPFLTDWIADKFPGIKEVGESIHGPDGSVIERPGIVHRLDRDTSGVILIAKTSAGHACLKKQFQARTIKKKYIAFVWGELKDSFGTIDRPIGRSSSDFRKWSAQRGARGEMREAVTYWEKIKDLQFAVSTQDGTAVCGQGRRQAYDQNNKEEKFTLVEVEPKTGRTHQIRVHFAAIQHPVVGDALYAPNRPTTLGFDRVALHAKSVEFDDCQGKRVKVEAPLPEDFELALAG
ncbi:RluA family pseudouridine synthase [Patescibacteria group bacterium]|nr:RluA family pseudouridine synthase [Patescibacteria group bacterium]MDE1946923.1 RluA family pseudouridine synthase [Patescibacteria group bacterium]MDE2011124.1 RluA family pseudouridine synthase [Patescibacteria group bacterium]MDE2233185.1 RluA family pseudouridine synthase [Patescibacteria group bacterium]